eukprot:scaffold3541_cov116-Cylindrotheca_fusiformis.AAC.2
MGAVVVDCPCKKSTDVAVSVLGRSTIRGFNNPKQQQQHPQLRLLTLRYRNPPATPRFCLLPLQSMSIILKSPIVMIKNARSTIDQRRVIFLHSFKGEGNNQPERRVGVRVMSAG